MKLKYKDKIKDIKKHKFKVILSSYTPTHDHKVPICHEPPGNLDNAHTISVSMNAVPAHLGHGDEMGTCEYMDLDEIGEVDDYDDDDDDDEDD